MRVEKTVMQTLTSRLSSIFLQLLLLFDQGLGVENTVTQTFTFINSHATLALCLTSV